MEITWLFLRSTYTAFSQIFPDFLSPIISQNFPDFLTLSHDHPYPRVFPDFLRLSQVVPRKFRVPSASEALGDVQEAAKCLQYIEEARLSAAVLRFFHYPLVICYIAIENGRRNSEWWFSIVMLIYQRDPKGNLGAISIFNKTKHFMLGSVDIWDILGLYWLYGYGSKLGTPKLWMVNTKLD